ncbi:MAG TPA: UvrD-helicase domain-containing protein [Candidatus Accumulibacter phosphatis]|nr:ATP-dependent DNA helicase Rep [Accumulibacter sp.]HRL75277.1 UvrD-helicase domain-containing protein [Candidatus Accumulibacter phosphatis]HRQ94058.1 UvrD-helicase domain-containing protein [Candidatus Accumulibacter phosphatis]
MSVLNPQQREAIRYLDGPLLVLAGAGSGKTRVITEKIVYLIESCGLQPRNIAAITFTNRAAHEMQQRVGRLLGGRSATGLLISTFHALGVRILREEAAAIGYKPAFSILDAADCLAILTELAGSVDKAVARRLQWQISSWKSALVLPEQAARLAGDEGEVRAASAYASYAATLRAYQAVDFDDLIALPVRLLQTQSALRDKWQNRLRYLLVDEYQDTNAGQYTLLRLLTGQRAAFTAVGDDDQSIYGWRGADMANLRSLPSDYPNLKVIKLEQNYRSTGRILKAANTLIANNEKLFDKKLWSELGPGDPITVSACANQDREAETVVMKLQAHRFEHQGRFSDYAILYRGNFQARALEQFLRNQRIPYRLSGGQSFFDRTEIRDIAAYLRLLANTDDDPAFIRAVSTPRRGVGSSTLQALGEYAGERHLPLFSAAFEQGFAQRVQARQLAPLLDFAGFVLRLQQRAGREPAASVISDLLAGIAYEEWLCAQEEVRAARAKWENVRELCDWLGRKAEEEGKTLLEVTQAIALISMIEKDDGDADVVQLSTLHAAKGLEFKHVFLIGVEEGVLPHREAQAENRLDEERRLMYVGITRAQRSLHLSYAEKRQQGRQLISSEASRFIGEMGREDMRFAGGTGDDVPDKAGGAQRLAALKALLGKAR